MSSASVRSSQLSRLDRYYRQIILARFFERGWGKPNVLKKLYENRSLLLRRDHGLGEISPDYPIRVDRRSSASSSFRDGIEILEGYLTSPLAEMHPDLVPKPVCTASFQAVIPTSAKRSSHLRPLCIQLAGTGDHGYWRRRNLLATTLARKFGVASILLVNPFYGKRKPQDQFRSRLRYVSDLYVMGGCLITECVALLNWAEREGFGPLCLTGISMGGHMAALAACHFSKPVAVVPCLTSTTASCVFTYGVMAGAINWALLQKQLDSEQYAVLLHPPSIFCGEHQTAIQTNTAFLQEPDDVVPLLWDTKARRSSHLYHNAIVAMWHVMNDFTYLGYCTPPVDTELATVVMADADAYMPQFGIPSLDQIWPGAAVRKVHGGHIGSYVLHQDVFRSAILTALNRAAEKYHGANFV